MLAIVLIGFGECRPPNQTAIQKQVWSAHEAKAQACSDAAKPQLLQMLNDPAFRQGIAGVPSLAKANASTLLEMLYQEIHYAYLSHNGFGGVSLQQVIQLGYLPTGWETICEGVRQYDPTMDGLNQLEMAMGWPNFPAMPPQKPDCYSRQVFTGVNIWKQSAGQLNFNSVSFILDTYDDPPVFISGVDTGCLGPAATQNVCFGNRHHFYHLILPHLQAFQMTLAQLFLRWYGKGPLPTFCCRYFEAELAAGFLLPERLLMLGASFAMFGDDTTSKPLMNWAKNTLKRPLMWADPENSGGSIMDSYVNHIDGEYNITKFDEGVYWGLYDGKATWTVFRNKTTPHLQLHLLGYLNHHYCDPSKLHGCHFLGVNHENQCLYWKK